jgi:hypothetical protein
MVRQENLRMQNHQFEKIAHKYEKLGTAYQFAEFTFDEHADFCQKT